MHRIPHTTLCDLDVRIKNGRGDSARRQCQFGEIGWEHSHKIIVSSLGGMAGTGSKIRVGVQAFSGPTNWDNYGVRQLHERRPEGHLLHHWLGYCCSALFTLPREIEEKRFGGHVHD